MGSYATVSVELEKQLQQLHKISSDLEGQWRMQSLREAENKHGIWKKKIDQICEEAAALQNSLDACHARHRSLQAEEAQRQELLRRRGAGMAVNNFDVESEGRERVKRSKQVVEEAYQTGLGVLSAMSEQRDRLKAAQRKVLDVLNTVGLSDSVLRIAERRISVDKLIAYGGMLVITVLLITLYWLFA